MIKPEVLAPAGSAEQLCAAVRAGADAVYMGYSGLSARAGAENPSGESLLRSAQYCRERGVKLYLAVNTLVRDGEWDRVLRAAEDIAQCGADGVIVQDLGVARAIKQLVPQVSLHGSTQMSVHTPAGARLLYNMGFKRVVLAREMSKKEIEEVVASCPIETEVFVHGAMCMSVSGQCYLSSVLGSRSGNRGLCAQPCRLPFYTGHSQYALSLKDMSLIGHIAQLKEMNVTSLKIEGRLKRPEYVAAAVAAYRAAVDGEEVSAELLAQLEAVFSRSGFSDGYFTGKRGKIMFGYRSKEDVLAANSSVFGSIHGIYREERQAVNLNAGLHAKTGEPLTLSLTDGKNGVTVTGDTLSAAQNQSADEQRIKKQLCKTGGTPYKIQNCSVELCDNPFIPLAAVNSLRREATELLSDERKKITPYDFNKTEYNLKPFTAQGKPALRAVFGNINSVCESAAKCELVFIPLEACETDEQKVRALINDGYNLGVLLPGANFGREAQINSQLKSAAALGIKHAMVQNLGQVLCVKNAGLVLCGGFRLNIANSCSVDALADMGFDDFTASFELTLSQIAALGGSLKRGIIAYGHLPLMIFRNCPAAGGSISCERCGGNGIVYDRRDEPFRVSCRMGCSELYNPVPLWIFDKASASNVNFLTLYFTHESREQAEEIFNLYFSGGKPQGKLTNGLYTRGVE